MTIEAGTEAVEHYRRRSAALYRLMTEGFVDGEQDACSCRDCIGTLAEDAHRIIGRAIEGEVFGDRESREDAA